MRDSLTVLDRILIAAYALSQQRPVFSAEELIVQAWKMAPDQFGLQGFSDKYPDSNRVLTKIMGTAGLRGKGWIAKVGEKRYRLTEAGKAAAHDLTSDAATKSSPLRMRELKRELVGMLERMLNSSAVTRFQEHVPLNFSDVCSFWNISARTTASQFISRTTDADHAIAEALRIAEASDTKQILLGGNGEAISLADIEQLKALSSHIREAFATEIAVIMKRRDERKL